MKREPKQLLLKSENWFSLCKRTGLKKKCKKRMLFQNINGRAEKNRYIRISKKIVKYLSSLSGEDLYGLAATEIPLPEEIERMYEMVIVRIPKKTPRANGVITFPKEIEGHPNYFLKRLTADQVIKHEGDKRKSSYSNVINRLLGHENSELTPEFLNDQDIRGEEGYYYIAVVYYYVLVDERYDDYKMMPCLSARIITDNTLIKSEILGTKKAVSYYDYYKDSVCTRDVDNEFTELNNKGNLSCIVDRMSASSMSRRYIPGAFFEIYLKLFSGLITEGKKPDYFYAIARIENRDYEDPSRMGEPLYEKYITLGLRNVGVNYFNVGGVEVPHNVLRGCRKQIEKRLNFLKYFVLYNL